MKHNWVQNGTQLHGYGVIRCTKCGMELTPYHQRDLFDSECKPEIKITYSGLENSECKPSDSKNNKNYAYCCALCALIEQLKSQREIINNDDPLKSEHLGLLDWIRETVEKGLKNEHP